MKILIHVVDLISDEPTILFGGLIAQRTAASITLLNVASKKSDKKTDRARGQSLLDEAVKVLPELPVATKIRRGNPTKKLLAEVEDGDYDLLLVPAWQVNRIFQQLPLASSGDKKRLPCGVFVVRNPKKSVQHVLICTGGMKVSRPVIEIGARLATTLGAHVTLLHVAGLIPSMYTGLETIEETLDELLKTSTPVAQHLRQAAEYLCELGISADLKLRHGSTAYEILRELDIGDYDLLVLGASGASSGWREWFLTNITQEVMLAAGVPVLVINQSQIDQETRMLFQ
ncbi:MAG: universal stress protein [Anaerolineales bacterium]|nr:universal stress protein [Anaerolineales bacterium]